MTPEQIQQIRKALTLNAYMLATICDECGIDFETTKLTVGVKGSDEAPTEYTIKEAFELAGEAAKILV